MSDDSDMSEIIAEAASLQFSVCLDCAGLAVLLYEYALTFSAECRHIWKPKKTLVFYLFIGLRYSALLTWVFEAFADFLPVETDKACTGLLASQTTFKIMQPIFIGGIFIFRAFATWNRNAFVFGGLTALLLGRVATSGTLWGAITGANFVATDFSRRFAVCYSSYGLFSDQVFTANSAITVVFDTAVVALTIIKTVQQVIICRKLQMAQGLSYYVFRDGILYFLAIEFLIVASVAVTYVDSVPEATSTVINGLQNILSIIIVQRLVLNLRQANEQLHSPSNVPSLDLGQLSFAHGPVLGNIGAPLRDTTDDALGYYHNDSTSDSETEEGRSDTGTRAIILHELAIEEVRRDV